MAGVLTLSTARAAYAAEAPSSFYAYTTSASASGIAYSGWGVVTATTDNVSVLTANGRAPFTFQWESFDSSLTEASNPTSPDTYFQLTGSEGTTEDSTWFCTVTDADGNEAITDNVSVSLIIAW